MYNGGCCGCEVEMLKSDNAQIELVWVDLRRLLVTDGPKRTNNNCNIPSHHDANDNNASRRCSRVFSC